VTATTAATAFELLIPTPTRTDAVTSERGVSPRLPWSDDYSASWSAVHTDSNSFLNSYNPLLTSGLSLTLSQPSCATVPSTGAAATADEPDQPRHRRTRLREASVQHHRASRARTEPVSAIANVDAGRPRSAWQELVRVNQGEVDVGQSPPLIGSAQAEVARR